MLDLIEFEISDDQIIGRVEADTSSPESLEQQLQEVLTSPSGFPPLEKAMVPGDRVVIVSVGNSERLDSIVVGVIRYLQTHGVQGQDITLLLEPYDATAAESDTSMADWQQRMEDASLDGVRVVRHDLRDENSIAYLAASESGLPIVFSRELLDADLIIPVHETELDASSPWDVGLCPRFSDAETQKLFLQSNQEDLQAEFHPDRFIEESIRLLGVYFTVELLPSGSSTSGAVLAGEFYETRRQARDLVTHQNGHQLAEPVEMIIADTSQLPQKLGIHEILQCIRTLAPCTVDDGTIVLHGEFVHDHSLSDWWEDERGLYGQLSDESPSSAEEANIGSSTPSDSGDSVEMPTKRALLSELASHLERIHIVLSGSELDSEWEDIGLGLAESPKAIGRLAQRYQGCLVVEDALRCRLQLSRSQS